MQKIAILATLIFSFHAQAQVCHDIFSARFYSGDPYAAISTSYGLRESFGENEFAGLVEWARGQNALTSAAEDFAAHQNLARHARLTATARAAIESRKENQFVVVFEGLRHTLELYQALGDRSDVGYISPDPNQVSSYEFFERLAVRAERLDEAGKKEIQSALLEETQRVNGPSSLKWFRLVIESALSGQRQRFENYIAYLLHSAALSTAVYNQNLKPKAASMVGERAVNAIVLADLHFIPLTEHVQRLPRGADLRARGMREVVLMLEGIAEGQEYQVADLARVTSVAEVVSDPATNALMEFMQREYIKNGIEVRVRGLE